MTEQRPEDNNQTPNDPGVWVDDSGSSGLTYDPPVWVERPPIDEDRLGEMIRDQSHVTDLGSVQEPDLGGVPQPGSAGSIHSLDLSSAYEEVAMNPQTLPPEPPSDLFDPSSTKASYESTSNFGSPGEITIPPHDIHNVEIKQHPEQSINADGSTNKEALSNLITQNRGVDSLHPTDQVVPTEPISPYDQIILTEPHHGEVQERSEFDPIHSANPFDPAAPGPTIDPNLFDPAAPGPTLDPSLLEILSPGPTLDAALLDPAAPGPTIDPHLLNPDSPGPTIDPALLDPIAPGPTLDPNLLDPSAPGLSVDPNLLDASAPGDTIDPALLDPIAPGPTLDSAQVEHGIVHPNAIEEPLADVTTGHPFTDDPSFTEAPATTGHDDVHDHHDFLDGGA